MATLSKDAHEWLMEWINSTGNSTDKLTERLMDNNNKILNELISEQYKKREYYKNVKLYRGTNKDHGDTYVFPTDRLTSWTYSINMAKNFGKYVYECIFNNDDILFDTTLIDDKDMLFDENEVIILSSRDRIANKVWSYTDTY